MSINHLKNGTADLVIHDLVVTGSSFGISSDGVPGMTGSTGSTGATGSRGPTGKDGKDGKDFIGGVKVPWVPKLYFGGKEVKSNSYNNQIGSYSIIGDMLFFTGTIGSDNLEGLSGNCTISLPPVIPSSASAGSVGTVNNVTSGQTLILGINTTNITLQGPQGINVTEIDIVPGFNFSFSGFYFIN